MTDAVPMAVELLDGFHPPETGDGGEFRWTAGAFRVRVPAAAAGAMLVLDILCYFDLGGQRLEVEEADRGFRRDGLTELPVAWGLELMHSSPECRTIALHGTGEPLLSGTFREMLRRAPPGEPRFIFSTNLTLLDGEVLALAKGGAVKEIIVSLDAARPETYRLIRGYDLDEVLANVRDLVRAKNAAGRGLPRLLAHMVLLRMNLGELPDFVRLAAELGLDGVIFWQANEGRTFYWVVERDGFRFDYREQRLDGNPEECGPALAEAVRLSRELGLTVEYDATIREFGLPDPEGGALGAGRARRTVPIPGRKPTSFRMGPSGSARCSPEAWRSAGSDPAWGSTTSGIRRRPAAAGRRSAPAGFRRFAAGRPAGTLLRKGPGSYLDGGDPFVRSILSSR